MSLNIKCFFQHETFSKQFRFAYLLVFCYVCIKAEQYPGISDIIHEKPAVESLPKYTNIQKTFFPTKSDISENLTSIQCGSDYCKVF